MIRLAEYLDQRGNSPFGQWVNRLNREAAAEVTYALTRLEHGHQSNVKAVGGGSKKRQSKDILQAKVNWKSYKRRKQQSRSAWH